jgi:methionyl aminopeptidase
MSWWRRSKDVIELKTPAEIEQMKPAGAFVAQVLEAVKAAAKPGVNLLQLDALAHQMIKQRGAESCYINYHPSFGAMPFGKVICTSVNDAVLHGLPHDYKLKMGDLLSLDFAASVNGWVADSALSLIVGSDEPKFPFDSVRVQADQKLIETTEVALEAGIAAAVVGNRIGDISAAIAKVAHAAGYSVNTDFGGHGVGRIMHGDPHVPNNGRAGKGLPLKPGLVIAIEPWFLETTDELFTDPDGWTLRSHDGSRGAHTEHTIAVTANGPLILTQRSS